MIRDLGKVSEKTEEFKPLPPIEATVPPTGMSE